MIIAHNMMANGANRQLKIAGNSKKKSTEKLSSGYRINRASDDAAGLSISEKMRGQIRGLSQGVRNVEDGISLCQVADGALSEVTSMLQRITELSVQSANDTNTDEDRTAIQNEISELLVEIDRIGETTSFNERKLFEGAEKKIIGYRPETVTNTISVPVTDSFSFSVSGESTASEPGTYTITANTSLSSGIVVNNGTDNTLISWDKVKDQNGSAIDLNNDIQAGIYSFEYKGMNVSFEVNRNVTATQLLSGLTGTKWTSKEGTPYVFNYSYSMTSKNYWAGNYYGQGHPKISFEEDGIYIVHSRDVLSNIKTRYDYPDFVLNDSATGTKTFQISEPYHEYTFSLTVNDSNNMSYEKIFEDLNSANISRSVSIGYDGLFNVGNCRFIDLHDKNELITEEELNYMINYHNEDGIIPGFGCNSYGVTGGDYFGSNRPIISWDDLYQNAIIGDTETTFTYNNDKYQLIFTIHNDILNDPYFRYHDISSALSDVKIHISSYKLEDPENMLYSYKVSGNGGGLYADRGYHIYNHSASVNKSIPSIWADTITEIPTYSYSKTENVESVIQIPIYDEEADPLAKLWIQYGANSGQALQLEIDKMNTTELGINNLNVTTREGAGNAISSSQQALQKVTASRSKIGAYQNRMEHIVDNENNAAENLQNTESRIRDADMAKEAVELAKQSILEQVGQSMISQANQNTQGILKLLQ